MTIALRSCWVSAIGRSCLGALWQKDRLSRMTLLVTSKPKVFHGFRFHAFRSSQRLSEVYEHLKIQILNASM